MRIVGYIALFQLVFLSFFQSEAISSPVNKDSLYRIINNKSLHDSIRFKAMDKLAWDLIYRDPDSTLTLGLAALEMDGVKNSKKWKSSAYNIIASAYFFKSDYATSLNYHKENIQLKKEMDDRHGLAIVYVNISNIYSAQGDHLTALEYLQYALNEFEKGKDKLVICRVYNNIGLVYNNLKDYNKAMEYFQRCLEWNLEIKNIPTFANVYNNIGIVYKEWKQYDLALENYIKSLHYYELAGDKRKMANIYSNLGATYDLLKEYEKAKEMLYKAEKVRLELKETNGLSLTYNSLGNVYYNTGDYDKSIEYCEKGLKLAENIGIMVSRSDNCNCLYKAYKAKGEITKALEYYEIYNSLQDSLFNNDKTREISRKEFKYEYEKKEFVLQEEVKRKQLMFAFEKEQAKLKAENEKKELELKEELKRKQLAGEFELEKAKSELENEKKELVLKENIEKKEIENESQKKLIFLFIGGFAIMSVLAIFIYRGYRYKQRAHSLISKQKLEVEAQKEIIEEKQKEIIDSINYAQRLQNAILASPKEINEFIPDNFLLYKPKDIVAGDFYFFETTDTHIFYAACDCTGHGVPGAMVSLVCSNALSRCVREFNLTDPGQILDKTRILVLDTFRKSSENVKDGMDISFISIERKTKKIKWAGANNPLWVIRNSPLSTPVSNSLREEKGSGARLEEFKADKQPIGHDLNPQPFTTHEIYVEKNDTIYLFTDGYADQFGGPKGKKFKYSSLQKILCDFNNEKLQTINSELQSSFLNWKGNLEQVDDVCVIGIRVN